ncbi:hypothetical protein TSMEX_005001 [Taenia solium]
MLALTAVLIFVVSTSSENAPKMWGSRVIGKPSGPSDTMSYEYNDNYRTVLINDSVLGTMSIKRNQCMLWETKPWGEPCNIFPGYVNITLNNVTAQKIMEMDEITARPRVASTTFFVPHCNFTKPAPGEVDVWTSFPLSRFVKDTPWFRVDFAVGGANYDSTATFDINATSLCFWRGTKLLHKGAEFCTDMVKDESADLRVFRGVFPRKTNISRESFAFAGLKTALTVSIDYSQSGISPEVADCEQHSLHLDLSTLVATMPAYATKTSTRNNSKTTSSGPASMHTCRAIIALLLIPMVL